MCAASGDRTATTIVTNMKATAPSAGSRPCYMLLLCALLATVSAELGSELSPESSDLLTSNHQLLSGLGLARMPGNLPKKVAASDDDSRVFVVRLPPSQHYYSLFKSPPALANSVSKQVEVGFRSNGKPARVYHWNIPVLKKMAAARRRSTQGSQGSGGKPSKQHPSKSKLGSKLNSKLNSKLGGSRRKGFHRVQAHAEPEPAGPSPYYYAPAKKTSMHKLLGGNGKPHAMYVLEKSKTPAFYQRLLP